MSKKFVFFGILATGLFLTSCNSDDDAPAVENEVEVITDVVLTFTNTTTNQTTTATAKDPDGDGVQPIAIQDTIRLAKEQTYSLGILVQNALDPADIESISAEIEEEADEHQFFFAFTENAFSNPTGDGNIDTAGDPLVYKDSDSKGLPLGLETEWVTDSLDVSGVFRLVLKHQPDQKSATSTATTGETDIDLTFPLIIE